ESRLPRDRLREWSGSLIGLIRPPADRPASMRVARQRLPHESRLQSRFGADRLDLLGAQGVLLPALQPRGQAGCLAQGGGGVAWLAGDRLLYLPYAHASTPPKLGNDFDPVDEVAIELAKLCRGDPVFPMVGRADRLHFITLKESSPDAELCHIADVSGSRVFRVPVTGDLCRVLLVQHRVENWLGGKPRREFAPTALANQIELFLAHRA